MGLSKAGGGAAPNLQNIGVDPVEETQQARGALGGSSSGLSSVGGYLSNIGGIASGVQKGGVGGGIQAASNAAGLYNKATGSTGGFTGLLGQAGSALNIYNGLTSGTPLGTLSGLGSAASLAASSGAASALGASSSAVSSLGAAGATASAVAAPFIFQQMALALGDKWTSKTTQGNAAMKGWMDATGAYDSGNPILTAGYNQNYSAANTFGTTNAQLAAAKDPNRWHDKNGNPMTNAQVDKAIGAWAKANGVDPGDFG